MRTEAYLSSDRKFRYWLTRVWDESLPMMGNIGCNPSTANETLDDPTIRKDMGFARRLGFGGILKLNVGAYRSTDPKQWLKAEDPIGPENSTEHIRAYLTKFDAKLTVAAWGRSVGRYASQGKALANNIPGIMCWGWNADKTPRHTLMLSYSTKLEPWSGE